MTAKQTPCTECAASGREPHESWCHIGRARSAAARKNQANRKKTNVKAPARKRRVQAPVTAGGGNASDPVVQVNRIALILDRSISMRGIHGAAIDALNAQINEIKLEAAKHGQPTYVSVYDFGSDVRCVFKNEYIHGIQPLTVHDIRINGMTALMDAVTLAASDFERLPDFNDPNVSFLVMTITDGAENASSTTQRQFVSTMTRLNATDRWSFVFSGPQNSRSYLTSLGVHNGNTQEWEQTDQGVATMAATSNVGLSNYMATRSAGATNTKAFFTVDMSDVSDKDIRSMSNVSSTFKVLKVNNAAAGGVEWNIRDFVEDRINKNSTLRRQVGNSYGPGLAYYQLTKTEDVQAGKDLAVRDKSSGKVYGGHEARALIGMPTNQVVRVKPGNFGNYDIFIKSTSVNRKLVRGTDVLYRVK